MNMNDHIGKQCVYEGKRYTIIGWAGNLYKLDSGKFAPARYCEIIDETEQQEPIPAIVEEQPKPTRRRGRKPKAE